MRLHLLRCDICGKEHQGIHTPNYWFEFYYEFSLSKDGKDNEYEYLTCSINCFYAQIERCLEWSVSHMCVKIAGMTRQFASQLLEDSKKSRAPTPRYESLSNGTNHGHEDDFNNNGASHPEQIVQTFEKPKKRGRVLQLDIDGACPVWLSDFMFQNSDVVLVDRMKRHYENDMLVLYDGSLLDEVCPDIPLIKYKSHSKIFIYESMRDEFSIIQQQNQMS